MNEINVLSTFDGMSCGQIALERAGIKVKQYFASEIDKYAIQVTQKNYPNTIQLGDINGWRSWNLPNIDLVIAGSPCQGLSIAGYGQHFEDPRSKLFFVFHDMLIDIQRKNPEAKFLLENVKMKKDLIRVITERMKVEPVAINSDLVSAQSRDRLYWANWTITQPEDKHIYLKDIIESGVVDREKSYCIDANYFKGGSSDYLKRIYHGKGKRQSVKEPQSVRRLMVTQDDSVYRKLSVLECERLQTVPEGYTAGVSNTQRYKMLGNGWTVDVIAHIFSLMEKHDE